MKLLFVAQAPVPLPHGAADILEKIWRAEAPDAIFLGGSPENEELAARLSIRLDARCVTGATAVRVEAGGFYVMRQIYGGEMSAEYRLDAPCLIVLDKGTDPGKLDFQGELAYVEPDYPKVKIYTELETTCDNAAQDLGSANKIIVAGRGLGSRGVFQNVSGLAGMMDAAAGATRALVYSGRAPLGAQIGVSGAAVNPKLCLILGASGSAALLAGIAKGAKIIAVNSDPDAPVFRRAAYGIVGDANEILRELVKLAK